MNTSETAFASNEDIFFDLYISTFHGNIAVAIVSVLKNFPYLQMGVFPNFGVMLSISVLLFRFRTGLCQKAIVNKNTPATERKKLQERGDHGSS